MQEEIYVIAAVKTWSWSEMFLHQNDIVSLNPEELYQVEGNTSLRQRNIAWIIPVKGINGTDKEGVGVPKGVSHYEEEALTWWMRNVNL